MPQSLNLAAVRSLGRVVRQPSLMLPHAAVRDLSAIDFAGLRAAGIKGVLLDKDNTVTAPYAPRVHPAVEAAINQVKETYGRNGVILSNSAGTGDDPGHREAAAFESSLGLPVLRHTNKKPDCLAEVLAYFDGDGDGGACQPHELCMIGDRILTDVVFGNLHGMLTVHTQIFTLEGDNRAAAFVRTLENELLVPAARRWQPAGRSPAHPCFPHREDLQRVIRE